MPLRPLLLTAAAVLAVAAAGTSVLPSAAAPTAEPTRTCTSARTGGHFIGHDGIFTFGIRPYTGGLFDKPPTTFVDDFSTRDTGRWLWTNYSDSCLATGPQGLEASVPAGVWKATYNNAELVSTSAYPETGTTTMRVRARAADLRGVHGTRGWGFWNTSLYQPLSGVAFFIYLDGPAGSSTAGGKNLRGFYALVQRSGLPPEVHPVDASYLERDTTYTVQLRPDGVVFTADGDVVYRTRTRPDVPMPARIWTDSAGNHALTLAGRPWFFRPQFGAMPEESVMRLASAAITYAG